MQDQVRVRKSLTDTASSLRMRRPPVTCIGFNLQHIQVGVGGRKTENAFENVMYDNDIGNVFGGLWTTGRQIPFKLNVNVATLMLSAVSWMRAKGIRGPQNFLVGFDAVEDAFNFCANASMEPLIFVVRNGSRHVATSFRVETSYALNSKDNEYKLLSNCFVVTSGGL